MAEATGVSDSVAVKVKDVELGGGGGGGGGGAAAAVSGTAAGAVVSLDANKMYVDVGATTAEERAALGVPSCLSNSGEWFGWLGGCCLLTVLLPLCVLLPLLAGGSVWWLYLVFLGAGLLWVLFSLRKTLWQGGVALPTPPDRSTAFVASSPAATKVPKKLYVVVNPHGGVKKGIAALEQVVLPVWRDEFGIEVTVLKTEYAGHARDLARTVDLTGYDGLCVIGGDGSYHEVGGLVGASFVCRVKTDDLLQLACLIVCLFVCSVFSCYPLYHNTPPEFLNLNLKLLTRID